MDLNKLDKIKEALDIVTNAIVSYSEKHPDEEVNGLIIYKYKLEGLLDKINFRDNG